MQRICVLALLHNGEIVIHNPGFSEDDKTTINVIESLGAVVTKNDGFLRIASEGKFNPPHEINFGESGLACRMFAPILALSNKSVTLNGKGTLLKRDMSDLMALLSSLEYQRWLGQDEFPELNLYDLDQITLRTLHMAGYSLEDVAMLLASDSSFTFKAKPYLRPELPISKEHIIVYLSIKDDPDEDQTFIETETARLFCLNSMGVHLADVTSFLPFEWKEEFLNHVSPEPIETIETIVDENTPDPTFILEPARLSIESLHPPQA